jgi:hypothetical protein
MIAPSGAIFSKARYRDLQADLAQVGKELGWAGKPHWMGYLLCRIVNQLTGG